MDTDKDGRIISFQEKPSDPPGTPEDPNVTLASMGIYVFNWHYLRNLLQDDAHNEASSHDFGSDLIPHVVETGKAIAHRFDQSCVRDEAAPVYWKDVGTIDAFWQAHVDLTGFTPELDLWDKDWPIWTYNEAVPPAKFIHNEHGRRGTAISSLIAGGCVISGTEVRNSILFTNVNTKSYAVLDHAVILPSVVVNRSAILRNVVVDRGVIIPEGLVVGEDPIEDAKWFRVTDRGIALITQDMLDKRAAQK
jgi:glucose-1-phosphate adenylyltransferase